MAREPKTVWTVTDDLSKEVIPEDEAVEVEFSYGGTAYVIDLGAKNAKALDDFLAPYIDAARPARPAKVSAAGPSRPGIILWARENGFPKAQGKPGPDIVAAYDKAHAKKK